jgi:membrane protein
MRQTLIRYWMFWKLLARRFIDDRGTSSAAALTYTTLFAVVPLLTVTFSVLSVIPAFQDVGDQINAFIFKTFLPGTGDALQDYLQQFTQQARQLTWFGVALLAVTSLLMLLTIEQSFNVIWRVSQPRRGLSSFLLYWAILSLGPLLLGAGFVTTTYLTSISLLSGPDALPGLAYLLAITPFAGSIATFTLIYAAVPNTVVPLRHALMGGLFAAFFLEVAKTLFAFYVQQFPGYQLIYGAFAAVPLFLLWIYVSWLIILLGAELVCSLSIAGLQRQQSLPRLLILLGVLRVFQQCQERGELVSARQLQKAGWLLPGELWEELVGLLQAEQLVCKAGSGGWVLSRDLSHYSLADLLRACPWSMPLVAELPKTLDEAWYPGLRAALLELQDSKQAIFSGSLQQWLRGEHDPQVAP